MATALTALATTTLASSSATVTFSSISGSFRDLRLVINARSSRTLDNVEAAYVQFNSDTGANYSAVLMSGSGSATLSATETQARIGRPDTSTGSNTSFSNFIVDIMDYTATDKHKTYLSRWNAQISDYGVGAFAGRWASTSAITSITINLVQSGSNWTAGSTFSLFGVSA